MEPLMEHSMGGTLAGTIEHQLEEWDNRQPTSLIDIKHGIAVGCVAAAHWGPPMAAPIADGSTH
jgi:hypothetical protein